ncbi:acyltransferase family protein [uncultured Corynebacterium sp.]|uniref:acyltransferase family protein n=1 Tax=uncultured Corynebacterium sp. TaxID=159447 RepID=UPI002597DDCD|nr:acyltransferase family protein [uncultured Corynebacterium sp.]
MSQTAAPVAAEAKAKRQNSAPKQRVGWVDAAKGLCILLVVLGHAITELQAHGYYTAQWAEINFFLGPIRMPLFFLLSGLFAGKALKESWHKLANRRIWVMVYLYVIWVPLRDFVLFLMPYTHVDADGIVSPPPITDQSAWGPRIYNTLHAVIEPTSYLWFLWALALFAILTRAFRWVHPVIQLIVSGLISAWAPFASSSWSWDFVSKMLFFYVLGMYGAPWIFRMAQRRSGLSLLGTLTAFLSVAIWVQATYSSFNEGNVGFTRVYLSTTGALAAINVMAMLQNTRLVVPFEKIGGRTLPIFLMHIPMLVVVMIICDLILPKDPHLVIMTPLVAIIAAMLCLGLHRLLLAIGAGWLFVRPAWVVRMTTPGQRALQRSQNPPSQPEGEAPHQLKSEPAS